MTPHYQQAGVSLYCADVMEALPTFAEASFDACFSDPPYGLTNGSGNGGFMNQKWDAGVPGVEIWREVYRALKPGGWILAAGGSRTHHRLACALEDAGFQIIDCVVWIFGSGFPKSYNYPKVLLSLPWCACGKVPSESSRVDAGSPSRNVGASIGTEPVSSLVASSPADGTGGLRLETARNPLDGNPRNQRGAENYTGRDFDPVVFGASSMTCPAKCDQITSGIGSGQIKPEALRNQVMNVKNPADSTAHADLIPIQDHLGDSSPSRSPVGPSPPAPSGISAAAQRLLVSDGHTFTGTVDRCGRTRRKITGESSTTNGTGKSGRPPSETRTAVPAKSDRLRRSGTGHGAELPSVNPGGENDAALLTGFGDHTSIIRELLTEDKVSICATCGRPICPSWIEEGYGTALKPAAEFWTLARKPFERGFGFAANALKWGVAGLNIDGCRIATDESTLRPVGKSAYQRGGGVITHGMPGSHELQSESSGGSPLGRWPANLILSCACDGDHEPDCPVRMLDEQSGILKPAGNKDQAGRFRKTSGGSFSSQYGNQTALPSDSGGASRFFYCAKASRSEREFGLKGRIPCVKCGGLTSDTHIDDEGRTVTCHRNGHPCVKSLDLCRYMAKLILPPARETPRRLLVPFAGSGSEMLGAIRAGWDEVVGLEIDEGYCKVAEARLDAEAPPLQRELARYDAELAEARQLLLEGHPDVQGLTLAVSDWSEERRMLEAT